LPRPSATREPDPFGPAAGPDSVGEARKGIDHPAVGALAAAHHRARPAGWPDGARLAGRRRRPARRPGRHEFRGRFAGVRGFATPAATMPARLRAQHDSAVLAFDRLRVNRLLAIRTDAAMRRLLRRYARATMLATPRIRLDLFLAIGHWRLETFSCMAVSEWSYCMRLSAEKRAAAISLVAVLGRFNAGDLASSVRRCYQLDTLESAASR
jgi:hypothetical protein